MPLSSAMLRWTRATPISSRKACSGGAGGGLEFGQLGRVQHALGEGAAVFFVEGFDAFFRDDVGADAVDHGVYPCFLTNIVKQRGKIQGSKPQTV